MTQPLRAAVIGAGKIGRHHAKWYARSGCQLAGWSVSSPDRLDSRAAELQSEVREIGQGFTRVESLLDELRPDLVSICTPAEHHYEPARAALRRGIPVLCEKPLVWGPDPQRTAAEADELVALAASHDVLLAVNLQYTYAAQAYLDWLGPGRQTGEVVLESRGKGTERSPSEIWMELGPHALSLVLGLLPDHTPDLSGLEVESGRMRAEARFAMNGANGAVAMSVICGQRPSGDLVRRFGLEDRMVDYEGRNNAAGDFACYLTHDGEERQFPDLMQTSLQRFVAAVETRTGEGIVSGAVGVANLALQLRVAHALSSG